MKRDPLPGRYADQNQGVAVHDGAVEPAAQLRGDLTGGLAEQSGQLVGVEVDQTAGHHRAVRVDQVHGLAGSERRLGAVDDDLAKMKAELGVGTGEKPGGELEQGSGQ